MTPHPARTQDSPPEIVCIVIHQIVRLRSAGALTGKAFEEQLLRLEREDLRPRGFSLLVRALESGRTRFIIRRAIGGKVCEMLDFNADGLPEGREVEAPPVVQNYDQPEQSASHPLTNQPAFAHETH